MAYLLKATTRKELGEKTRAEGHLPAVAYGGGKENVSLDLNLKEFLALYKTAGDSSLIDLEIDGKNIGKVLVQEVQYDPVKNGPTHVDLRCIDMNKAMQAPISLKFVGEAPAVKEMGGTLIRNTQEIFVECLPKDLVSAIEINVSVLKTFNESIKVRDIMLPPGIKILQPQPEVLVIKAVPTITDEQVKAMEEANKDTDITKIEVAGKKKEDEEGTVEGEEGEADKGKAKEEKKSE